MIKMAQIMQHIILLFLYCNSAATTNMFLITKIHYIQVFSNVGNFCH